MLTFIKQFFVLFVMQLKVFRQIGITAIVISALLPLLLIFLFKLILGSFLPEFLNNPDAILFIITGNIILGLSNICIIMLSQTLSNMREINAFQYYATLPINKLNLVIAIIASYLCLSLPGFILILYVGAEIFKFTISPNIWVIVVMLLCTFSFTGVGALIGCYSRTQIGANLLANIVGFGLLLLCPVFYPMEILTKPHRIIALLFPPTYAADALRKTVIGIFNEEVMISIIILLLMTILSFYFTARKIKWQEI